MTVWAQTSLVPSAPLLRQETAFAPFRFPRTLPQGWTERALAPAAFRAPPLQAPGSKEPFVRLFKHLGEMTQNGGC